MHDPDGFAHRLDQILRIRRIGKMYALAVELGIDESALSRWRRGKPISVGNLVRLAGCLRISIDWLLTGVGSMERAEPDADDAWQSEILADLTSLDPLLRDRFVGLMRHLAEARRGGCFEPGTWPPDARFEAVRVPDHHSVGT